MVYFIYLLALHRKVNAKAIIQNLQKFYNCAIYEDNYKMTANPRRVSRGCEWESGREALF